MAKAKTAAPAKPATAGRGNGNGTAIANRGANALALAKELRAELAADAGKGFEEAGRDAYAVPFLRILQDLSPQVKKKMAGYIPGAVPGQIFNTATGKLYKSIRVIPCHWSQNFIEWKPDRGGFVAAHPPGAPIIATAIRDGAANVLANGNTLMDTRNHFVLLLDEETGTHEGALIAMSSTNIGVSKRWMSQMRAAVREVEGRIVQAPMFASSYLLSSEEEANDKGSWYKWTITDRQQVVSDPPTVEEMVVYRAAKQFGLTMKSGNANVDYEKGLRDEPRTAAAGVPEDLGTGNEIDA